MLTKIKRIRRKKYAVGDEVRDFKNLPKASEPQQGGLGTRNQNIDKYVTDQIKSPELAPSATQSYTQQGVQSNELLGGNVQVAPTDVGTTTITGSAITAPTALTSTAAAAPSAFNVSNMTAQTGTAQTGTAQTGTVGTNSQIGTVAGSLSGTATGATGGPYSSSSCK